MDFILHGYCGLYCGACPIMLNAKAGAGTEQCYGCKSEQPTGYCAVCGIKACARGKGYEFCNECSEYSTCERMQKFLKDSNWPYQQLVSNNMELDPAKWTIEMVGGTGAALALYKLRRVSFVVG